MDLFYFFEKNKTNYYHKIWKQFIWFWDFFTVVGFYIFEGKKAFIFVLKFSRNKNGWHENTSNPKQNQNDHNLGRQWVHTDDPHLRVELIAHESWPSNPHLSLTISVCFKTTGTHLE